MQWTSLLSDLESGSPRARRFEAEEGTALIRQGEGDPPVYFLASGSIQVVKRIEDGKSMALKSSEAPAIVGDVEALLHKPALCSVIVRRAVTGYAIAAKSFRDQYRESPDWSELILIQLAERLSASDSHLVPRVLRPIRSAVAQAILDRLPHPKPPSGERVWHQISKTEIAEEIGATYRSVSRAFAELSSRSVIEYRRGRVRILNLAKLAHLLEEV
ncbi:MAG: Crp/Fnr family transcriptional regulator [Spirochaetota bacterium]